MRVGFTFFFLNSAVRSFCNGAQVTRKKIALSGAPQNGSDSYDKVYVEESQNQSWCCTSVALGIADAMK